MPPKGWKFFDTSSLALKGVKLVDPSVSLDIVSDLTIRNGIIDSIGPLPRDFKGQVIDCRGLVACPGLFDMHVHLREPGYEHKETVQSGCIAAAAGGFTGVAPMPNTNPVQDNPGIIAKVRSRAEGLPVDVHPIAAVTTGRKGEILTEIIELHEEGVNAFSDDGSPVPSANLFRLALEYTLMFDGVVIEHCEDASLNADGVIDEGLMSTELGLPGMPSVGEEIAVFRAVSLARYTGGSVHIAHVSTANAADIIRRAKSAGVNVTAEVTPHHLTLDSGILATYNSDYKVNPPLRSKADVEALAVGLADGTIDVIASDHAPHAPDEKEVEFIHAPFGMTGLETTLGIVLTRLVKPGIISLARAIDAMSHQPRKILRLPPAALETGSPANLTIIDLDAEWTVDRNSMLSKSRNTPFHGWKLTGRSRGVINREIAWIRDN